MTADYIHMHMDRPTVSPRVMYACASSVGVTMSEWRWASWGMMGMGASAAGPGAWLLARSRDWISRPVRWEECWGHTCDHHKITKNPSHWCTAFVDQIKSHHSNPGSGDKNLHVSSWILSILSIKNSHLTSYLKYVSIVGKNNNYRLFACKMSWPALIQFGLFKPGQSALKRVDSLKRARLWTRPNKMNPTGQLDGLHIHVQYVLTLHVHSI